MIKSIQTVYKGCKYRSELDARWAVFFDACGYDWEYEPEGYDINGVYYLPTFRMKLVDLNGDTCIFFFDVRPDVQDISQNELDPLNLFGEELLKRNGNILGTYIGYGDVILLDGMPDENRLYYGRIQSLVEDKRWCLAPGYRGRPSFWDKLEDAKEFAIGFGGVVSAGEIAKTIKFERGETPASHTAMAKNMFSQQAQR
jgi:hypothetical protein